MNSTYHIGAVDIGGTKIAVSIADATGPLARIVQPTAKSGTSRAPAEQVVSLLREACIQANIEFETLQAVGVSACGPFIRINDSICMATPNICGGLSSASTLPNDWTSIPLEQVLREHISHLVIENDCVSALMGERTFGAVRGHQNCIYATWSTGIGFGLCVDGHMLRGKDGNAGHAGHMLMSETSSAICGCGNIGDLESLISGRNLAEATGISASDLFANARKGEAKSNAIVRGAARWLGRALYNLTATLDTQIFVIGGSVWMHHGEWLTPIVKQEIESRFPALTREVQIVPALLGEMVADMGAFSLVMPREWLPKWLQAAPWKNSRGR